MMSRVLRSLFALVPALALGAAPAPRARVEPLQSVTAEQRSVPILGESAGGAAGLEWQARCSRIQPGLAVTSLRWKRGAAAAGEQRIDITAFRDGFASGRYLTTAPMAADRTTAALEKLEPGINYYWRVLIRAAAGWVPSAVARLEAPTCPVDSVVERDQD